MIASLAMYNRRELTAAHANFWALIWEELLRFGIDAPRALSQNSEEFSVWQHPELVLSQTCGMPYRLWLHEKVNLVGTLDYAVTGCPEGFYRSAIIVRADDPRDDIGVYLEDTFAYNQHFSQSGFAAMYNYLGNTHGWFKQRLQTGQHLLSARAVAEGEADIAALDAITWRLAIQHETFTKRLRVLNWTEPTPALPLITAKRHDPAIVFKAVSRAIPRLSRQDTEALGIRGIVLIPKENYLVIANPPEQAH